MKLRIQLALVAALAWSPSASRAAEEPCDSGRPRVADLGIRSLECDCTIQGRGLRTRTWRFRNEPAVRSLRPGSPAATVLRDGDVVTAVDGHLITTLEGGRRFANLTIGEPVLLRVRREGRVFNVRLAPESVCPEEALLGLSLMAPLAPMPPVPMVAPAAPETPPEQATPRAPRAPRAELPELRWLWTPEAPGVFERVPRGWFGMSLNCSDCRSEHDEGDRTPVWTFRTPPEVGMVEPGSPAARGGLRAGDQLTHMDRVLLDTEEGGRKFGATRPGQRVEFTLQRGGAEQRVTVVAGARPEPRIAQMDEMLERVRGMRSLNNEKLGSEMARLEAELAKLRSQRDARDQRLRYAGSVGGSDVEVRGLHNVVVNDDGDEIIIITSDARIVIKPSAKESVRRRSGNKK